MNYVLDVIKIGTRFKERMRGEERPRGEMRVLEERLSRAKGWPPILFSLEALRAKKQISKRQAQS